MALLCAGVLADVPAECTRDEVYGTWDFHVSTDQSPVNLFKSKEVCTHMLPNRQQSISPDFQFSFAQQDTWKIKMENNFLA